MLSQRGTFWPVMDMSSLAKDMAEVDRMFGKSRDTATGTTIVEPSYSLTYSNNGAVIEVELPGVRRTDIEVEVKERVLNIVAKRYEEEVGDGYNENGAAGNEEGPRDNHSSDLDSIKDHNPDDDGAATVKKMRLQYRLRIHLGADADGSKMKCKSYNNGVLLLTLPSQKKEPVLKIRIE